MNCCAFHDIEFSLDYATQAEQDAQRGQGNWALIHQQAERCLRLHIPVTIIAVMMKSNYLRLADVARVAKQFDAPLRVNVYQAVRSDVYALSYEEYWEGFRRLFERDRRNRNWRAAGSRNGGTPTAPRRLWREHCTSDTKSHDTTLRLLAGIRRAAFRLDHDGARHSRLGPLRPGPHTSSRVPALRVPRLVPRRMCRTAALARRTTTA